MTPPWPEIGTMQTRYDASKRLPYRLNLLLDDDSMELVELVAKLRNRRGADPNLSDAVRFIIADHRRRLMAGEIADPSFYGKRRL